MHTFCPQQPSSFPTWTVGRKTLESPMLQIVSLLSRIRSTRSARSIVFTHPSCPIVYHHLTQYPRAYICHRNSWDPHSCSLEIARRCVNWMCMRFGMEVSRTLQTGKVLSRQKSYKLSMVSKIVTEGLSIMLKGRCASKHTWKLPNFDMLSCDYIVNVLAKPRLLCTRPRISSLRHSLLLRRWCALSK